MIAALAAVLIAAHPAAVCHGYRMVGPYCHRGQCLCMTTWKPRRPHHPRPIDPLTIDQLLEHPIP